MITAARPLPVDPPPRRRAG